LAYHIVTEEHRAKLPKVKSFVDWLLREFKQTMSEVPRSRNR
jgi:hypothetical protein